MAVNSDDLKSGVAAIYIAGLYDIYHAFHAVKSLKYK